MTLHRFFVEPAAMSGDRFPLPAAIERQVRRVLRLRDGERIVLLADDGEEVVCRLEKSDCVVEERRVSEGEPAHRLTVVQALVKGDGLEEVIGRGTEVGVASFELVVTDRCVARELSDRRLDRLRTIAREAAEQSERGRIPEVRPPVSFEQAIARGGALLFERHDGQRLRDVDPPARVLIGPEGGFTTEEVERAVGAGLAIVGLGPRILRSQTVAAAVASVVLSRTGDFA